MNQLEICNPWPTIFKKKYDFDFENKLKPKVIDYLKSADQFIKSMDMETPEKNGGVTSVVLSNLQQHHEYKSHNMPHEWPELAEFKKFIMSSIPEILRKWHCDPGIDRDISRSWINVHPQGAYTMDHNHYGVLMAIAAYLYVPKNGGNLLLKNPLTPYKFGEPMHQTYFSEDGGRDGLEWSSINVETGDVVFFPGWVNHKTEKNSSKENRFVMSWNVSFASMTAMGIAMNKYSRRPASN